MRILIVAFALCFGGCASQTETLPAGIEKYYPQGSGGVMGLGREVYIHRIYDPKNSASDFNLAYRGDSDALQRFLSSKDKDVEGEPGERWLSDVVVLSLRWKDADLHEQLLRTEPLTRNYVCHIMTTYLDLDDRTNYPKTLSLYDPKPFRERAEHVVGGNGG